MHLRRSQSFTLIELLISVTIIGILASMALAYYRRTLERQYRSQSRDILFAIHAGERVYFFENANQYKTVAAPADWNAIFMENPNTPQIPVTFTVTAVAGPPSTFTATATRTGTTCRITIDDTRTIGVGAEGVTSWPLNSPPGCP